MTKTLVIHTDGACHGNPGPGGYGAWWEHAGERWESLGGVPDTTNNRMELEAVVHGLRAFEVARAEGLLLGIEKLVIRSDSQYVVKGLSEWIHGWKKNGWRNSAKAEVKNQDIWKVLDVLWSASSAPCQMEWVKGHAGDPHNEHADSLAQEGAAMIKASTKKRVGLRRRVVGATPRPGPRLAG